MERAADLPWYPYRAGSNVLSTGWWRETEGQVYVKLAQGAPFPLGPHSPAHSVGELSHAA